MFYIQYIVIDLIVWFVKKKETVIETVSNVQKYHFSASGPKYGGHIV